MAEEMSQEELKEKIIEYLKTVDKAKNRDIANKLGVKKRTADKAINELAKADIVEFLYIGTSYVKLKEQ